VTRWLALFALAACSQVTSTDRAKTAERAVDAMRATCLLYGQEFSGIPESPELEAVCPVLLREPVVTVQPVDAGTEGGS
jgi:hypothetical protein